MTNRRLCQLTNSSNLAVTYKRIQVVKYTVPTGQVSQMTLEEVKEMQSAFGAALKARDRAALGELEPKLVKCCETAVPGYQSSPLRENLEVIIVAVIVALGIRAYYLQPFKIPTASMQPTLNGITAQRMEDEKAVPNVAVKGWEYVWRGQEDSCGVG